MVSKKNVLSNTEMMDILRNQRVKFNGVYMKNELPSKLKRGSYIINLQSSFDGNGTHWCAFYYDKPHSYYFDSYGFLAPVEVHNKIIPYYYNDSEIQNIDSTACGFYCLAFVIFMEKNENKKGAFEGFVNLFTSDTKKNERILHSILYD
jgi:hypothetical protein